MVLTFFHAPCVPALDILSFTPHGPPEVGYSSPHLTGAQAVPSTPCEIRTAQLPSDSARAATRSA